MSGKQCTNCDLDESFRGTGWISVLTDSNETFICPRCVTHNLLEAQKQAIIKQIDDLADDLTYWKLHIIGLVQEVSIME